MFLVCDVALMIGYALMEVRGLTFTSDHPAAWVTRAVAVWFIWTAVKAFTAARQHQVCGPTPPWGILPGVCILVGGGARYPGVFEVLV